MTFSYPGADISKIIKYFYVDGHNYNVYYMDGTESEYTCYNEQEKERLTKLMIDQAIQRQEVLSDMSNLKKQLYISNSCVIASTIFTALGAKINSSAIVTIGFVGALVSLVISSGERKKIKELKKYKLFLEMVNDLDKINKPEILKSIEFEPIYQVPLDITTVDQFTYGDIKFIHKQYVLLNFVEKMKQEQEKQKQK